MKPLFLHARVLFAFALVLPLTGCPDVPGGASGAAEAAVAVELSDLISTSMPNLTAALDANTDWKAAASTDEGSIYVIPFIRGHQDLLVFFGPQLRADWLAAVGKELPETVAEWETVLTAFKTHGLSSAPLTFTGPRYGRGIGAYLDTATDASFDIAATKYPVLNVGDTPFYGQRDQELPGAGYIITTDATDRELCAELADYPYSDEGHILFNFGIEGESFEWVTDYSDFEGESFPRFTDMMRNDPEGRTFSTMGRLYARSFTSGAMIQDERYIYQYAYRPAQRTAIERWSQTDAPAHMIPGITPTEAETAELGAIREDLSQCRYGWTVEFITGTKDLSEYAQFQTELENYGVARAIEIIQAAVDRYESR